MNGVEAAASLFGSEDPASDPFASLGTDTTSQPDSTSIAPDFLIPDPHSSNLFGADENALPDTSQSNTWSEPPKHNYDYNHGAYSQELSVGGSSYDQSQGWYDDQGQWHGYEQQTSEPTLTAQEHSGFQNQSIPSNPYDPYAHTSNYSLPTNPSSYTQPSYPTPQQPTNSYAPPVVPTPSPSQPMYKPYAPSATSQFNSSYASTSQTPYTTNVAVPPPPSPAATINRPKVTNAYDPPFPTSKSTRRGASARTAFGQQAYTAYQSHTAGSRPPPIVRGASALPADQQGVSSTSTLNHVSSGAHGRLGAAYHNAWSDPNQNAPASHGQAVGGVYDNDSQRQHFIEDLPAQSDLYVGDSAPHSWAPREPLFNADPTDGGAIPHQPTSSTSELDHGQPEITRLAGSKALLDEHGFEPSNSNPVHTDNYSSFSSQDSQTLDQEAVSFNSFGVSYNQCPPSTSPEKLVSSHASSCSPQNIDLVGGPPVSSFASSPLSHGTLGRTVDSKFAEVKTTPSDGSFPNHSHNGSQESTSYTPSKNDAQAWNNYNPPMAKRTSSPASVHFLHGSQSPPVAHAGVANPYVPKSSIVGNRASSPGIQSSRESQNTPFDLYTPKTNQVANGHGLERTASPSSFSNGPQRAHQYIPSNSVSIRPDQLRNRSMSNGSVFSSSSASPGDPYATSQYIRQQLPSETSDYGSYSSRHYHPHSNETAHGLAHVQAHDIFAGQEVLTKPTQAPYAPSPSLMGANDPLGRTAARIPVFSFGFGGKLVTCFHGADSLNTGFDVALASRNSTGIHIRVLNKIIPASALNTSTASYPGPLFSDPGTPTTSLVRAGASAQTKTKKGRIVKYLTERAEEISRGIGYLNADSVDRRQAEGKLVLVRLLKVMIENDGRLSGTPRIDTAVRAALVPQLDASGTGLSADSSNTTPAVGFPSVVDIHVQSSDLSSVPYSGLSRSLVESNEAPIAISTLRPSALDKIQDFLLRGERRQAYHYALDERLWPHAMIIASSINKEAWKEVVNEFLKSELGVKDEATRGPSHLRGAEASFPVVNGREGLRVAYSLFSGQGAAAVQELVPQNLLSRATGRFQLLPTISHVTPITPNFAAPSLPANIPVESLSKWAETAAMMFSSPLTPESSAALTALGDQLLSNQWIEAAHSCYLLAPQTSPMGGLGNPSARIVLLGSRSPQVWPNFSKDPDPIIFSEIVEFALSLTPPAKGQDAFNGLPHLQAYRLVRAISLAEVGDIQLSNRYCEAITASFSRSSPYFTGILLEQLKGLSDRIIGVSHVDKSGSWIGGKLSKPSLDTIGGWLEGRFTKLVTGDADSATPPEEESTKTEERAFIGPFSHYSTISSATPSASPSPQPSTINANVLPPLYRSGSAMEISPPNSHVQIDRASSAMDYIRRRPSPVPRIASAGATATALSPSFGQVINSDYSPRTDFANHNTMTPRPSIDRNEELIGQEPSWWSSSSYSESSTSQTPTAATFLPVDETAVASSSEGFISLMDDATFSVAPRPAVSREPQHSPRYEDEEDLGFGNSKPPPGSDDEMNKASQQSESPQAEPERPESKPAVTGSWISRWWGRGEATPGPIKASLGEEKTFYYDKDLKRWVNKKAGGEESTKQSVPPPPPSRAQTTSPGRTGPRLPNGTIAGAPPARSASAIDLSTSPPSKTVVRVRSNLIPPTEAESAPNIPTGSRLAPPVPPPGRPKSQASKRNIRSRYVDVLQPEGGI